MISTDAPGVLLLDRRVHLQAGPVLVTDLRVEFKIRRSLKIQGNRCDIKVYNLNRDSRASINEKDFVTFSAGYLYDMPTIFNGQIEHVIHSFHETEIITHIHAVDGLETVVKPGETMSLKATSVIAAIREIIGSRTTTDPGNFETYFSGKTDKKFTKMTATKSPWEMIQSLSDIMGAMVTIQNNQFQFHDKGKAIFKIVAVLSPQTGLVGQLDVGRKGITKARALIQSDLTPGHMVQIRSKSFDEPTNFRIDSVQYVGDTHGKDWTAHLDLVAATADGKVETDH